MLYYRALPSILILILSLLPVSSSINAATRFTYQTSRPKLTIGSMIQPAAVETSTVWLGEDAARIDKGDGSIYIFDRKAGVAYRLFPKFELYESTSFIPTDSDTTPVAPEENMMAGLSRLTDEPMAQIEAAPDTGTVDGYLCRKYVVREVKQSMITIHKTSEVWATTAIDVDFELYRAIMNIADLVSRGRLDVLANLSKIEGVTVRRIGRGIAAPDPDSLMPAVTIDGNDSVELLKVETLPAPEGLFMIPSGYLQSKD